MLWTLIISLILRRHFYEIGATKQIAEFSEHTPGFHELDAVRMEKMVAIMENKLNSAIARHDKIGKSLARASQNNKSSQIQHWIFLKKCTARERVDRSQIKFKIAHQDLIDSRNAIHNTANQIVNKAYNIAYNKNSLIYKLATLRSK